MDAAAATFNHEDFLKYYDRRVFKFSAAACVGFLVYLPIGLVLMAVRAIILCGLVLLFNLFPCLNKNAYLIRFTSISLGIHTSLRDRGGVQTTSSGATTSSGESASSVQQQQKLLNIFVANHVSAFDYVAIKSAVSEANYFMSDSNKARVYQSERGPGGSTSGYLAELVASRVVNILKSRSLKDDEDNLENQANYPLIAFPEVVSTHGRYGLLKFDPLPFDLDSFQAESTRVAVTPVCVQMRRPLLAFNNNYYKASDLYDVLVTIFAPITIYEVSFLKPELKRAGESSEEFADRVQRTIAGCLNLKCAEYTYEDMRQMCASYIRHRQIQFTRLAASRQAAENAAVHHGERRPSVHMTDLNQIRSLSIDKLALQVKEILPYVAYNTIQMHISKSSTLDIDTIIASILDSNQEESECPKFTLDGGAASSSSSSSLLATGETTSKTTASRSAATLASSSVSSSSASLTPSNKTGSSSSSLFSAAAKKSPSSAYLNYDERKFNLINEARQRYLAKHPEYYAHAAL